MENISGLNQEKYMTNYFRPNSLTEALSLLENQNTIPLAGGTYINTKMKGLHNLVDLQSIGLNQISIISQNIEIGSTVKLEQLVHFKSLPDEFRNALKLEAPLNLRNSISLGGFLITSSGRSPVSTSLLALGAMVVIEPNKKEFSLSEFFSIRPQFPRGSLIVSVKVPLEQFFSFNYIARTPYDQPIVCAALSARKSGRTRLALGGFGNQPLLVLDGDIKDDLSAAAFSAYKNAEDEWSTAEYRSEMAKVLSTRCLEAIKIKL